MAKITVEFFIELYNKVYRGDIFEENAVELLNEKASEGEWNYDLSTIPKDSREFIGITEHGMVKNVHYACDLSGEEQPPFEGIFYKSLSQYYSIKIFGWMPLPNKPV